MKEKEQKFEPTTHHGFLDGYSSCNVGVSKPISFNHNGYEIQLKGAPTFKGRELLVGAEL
jgi:hypothetical protein